MLILETEWNTDKNPKPFREYFRSSTYKAWWRHTCDCGELHEWEASINAISRVVTVRTVLIYLKNYVGVSHYSIYSLK